MIVSYSIKIMFLKYLVLVILVLNFVQSESVSNSCNLTVLPPDPASGCCGIDASGGSNTPIRQFPWHALIEYKNDYDGSYEELCNGALISGVFVLTSAQCVSKAENRTLTSVRLGEYDLSNEFQSKDCVEKESGEECTPGAIRIPIESYKAHPQYKAGPYSNDIALIKLAKTVYYTSYIRPLCLPSSDISINPPDNVTLVVAGWGLINRNDNNSKDVDTDIKRHIHVPLWTSRICKQIWINGEKQICAGGDGISGLCSRNGGSPLMYDDGGVYQAVGVVSLRIAAGCVTKNSPDIYTKVFTYKSWINEVMEDKKEDQKEYRTPRNRNRNRNRNGNRNRNSYLH